MQAAFLLFFLLFQEASVLRPPTVHVAINPITKAAYLQALKGKISLTPHVTFSLKKQQARLVIPSDKGPHVFRDGWVDGERDEDTQYKYLGYWPELLSCGGIWMEGHHFSVARKPALIRRYQPCRALPCWPPALGSGPP